MAEASQKPQRPRTHSEQTFHELEELAAGRPIPGRGDVVKHFFSSPYDTFTRSVTLLTAAREIRDTYPDADLTTVRQLLDQIEGHVAAIRAQFPRPIPSDAEPTP